ncbi:hypothetical protein SeMB42_g00004 [Synchytrium endobioticum]|uniref:Uncharacterized protein n=1 Tax=Synchytrium endobioticum TaxID=286115 RepID=A0A507DAK5_9FUNG|nr:hypothetical protein SeLEV6574_g02073 [Synchytrium endobioticum]TPX55030.1 hypothetical protein SeMB42_g00004 [Synchytrium endobioticum]
MEQFLAYQVQREVSLLLKQTAFLEHLDERLGSHNAKTLRTLLLTSDIPDDNVWLSTVRDVLGSQELFEEFKRAFDIHDDVTSDDTCLPNDLPMSELLEHRAALIRKKGDDMSDVGSLDRPARRRRVTFDQHDSAVDVLGNLASSAASSSLDAPVDVVASVEPVEAALSMTKERSWSPPRPPTPITKIFPLLPLEPIEKASGGAGASSVVDPTCAASSASNMQSTAASSTSGLLKAPSQAQPPSAEALAAPSPRLESKVLSSCSFNSSLVGLSSTVPSSSTISSPKAIGVPTSVALIDRPTEMVHLMSNQKDLFSQINMVLGYDDEEAKESQWRSLLLATRDRLDDDAWMRAIAQTLQDEPALLSQFKDMVGYLGDVDDDVLIPANNNVGISELVYTLDSIANEGQYVGLATTASLTVSGPADSTRVTTATGNTIQQNLSPTSLPMDQQEVIALGESAVDSEIVRTAALSMNFRAERDRRISVCPDSELVIAARHDRDTLMGLESAAPLFFNLLRTYLGSAARYATFVKLFQAPDDVLTDSEWYHLIVYKYANTPTLRRMFRDVLQVQVKGSTGGELFYDSQICTPASPSESPSSLSSGIQLTTPTNFYVMRRGPQDLVALEEQFPSEFHHLQANLSMREYEAVVLALQSSRNDLNDDDWVDSMLSLLSDAPQVDGMSAIGAVFKIAGVRVAINTNTVVVEPLTMDDAISEATTLQGRGLPSLQELSSASSGVDTVDASTVTTLSSCHTAREELPVLMPTIEMLYAVRKGLADERVFGKILPRYILTKHNRRASISSLTDAPGSLPEPPSKVITQLLDELVGPNSPAFKRFTHFVDEGGMSEFESTFQIA